MPEETVQSLTLLYCYAPEDQHWAKEIDLHLSHLKRQCHIVSRFDGELLPNPERKGQLLAQLSETDLVLLLISPHFQHVESFWDEISHEAWAVRWLGGCRVVVLLLEPVDWSHAPYSSREILPRDVMAPVEWQGSESVAPLEVFPHDVRPLTQWQSQELAFQNIEQRMRVALEKQWLARGDYLRDEGGGVCDKEALAAYNEALRLNSSLSQAWYGKAHVLLSWKRYEEALRSCDEALRLDPAFSWAWYMKGNALAGLNRSEEALDAYDQALRLDPTFSWAWYEKAAVLVALQRYAEALQTYDEVLQFEPSSAWAWHGKSALLKVLGRRKEARQAYKQARQLGWRS